MPKENKLVIICPSCGCEAYDIDFCPRCFERLEGEVKEPEEESHDNSLPLYGIILFVFLFFVLMVFFP